MKVRILVANPYLDDRNNAVMCQPGDVLKTQGWYAASLIASGYAEAITEAAPDKPTEVRMVMTPAEENIEKLPSPVAHFKDLPSALKKFEKALIEAGIPTDEALRKATEDSSVVNVVGIKAFHILKKHYGIGAE